MIRSVLVVAGLMSLVAVGCERQEPSTITPPVQAAPGTPIVFSDEEIRQVRKLSPLPSSPPPSPTNRLADDPAAARLGHRLFFDARLSSNGQIACATCHDPDKGFSDGLPVSQGLGKTDRHSQSLWNVAYQRWFFWDGRTDSLWAQSIQPMLDEREMGATPEHLQDLVSGDEILRSSYEDLFGSVANHSPDRLLSNLGKAFEAFERKLINDNSPFDRFVAALPNVENSFLDEPARRGLKLFVGRGQCTLCHTGSNFTDGEFHNIGLSRNPDLPKDSGRFEGGRKVKIERFNGLGEFSDDRSPATNIKLRYLAVKMNNLGEFKTPSLRNVAETAPYMHDGRFATLRDVLDFYSELPGDPPLGHREETLVPLELTDQDKDDLEAFLQSLSGRQRFQEFTRAPPQ